jgi:hypothetical protein
MQTSFDFTPGLTVQFPMLRDCIAATVYGSRGGLKAVAADCDLSPSELTRMLNRDQDDPRKLDVDILCRVLGSTGDTRPIQWLIEKFLHNPEQQRATALAQIAQIMPAFMELFGQAGVRPPTAAKARR